MMDALRELRTLALRLTDGQGVFPTALPGVTLIRADALSAPTPVLYTPRVCVGIAGQKSSPWATR